MYLLLQAFDSVSVSSLSGAQRSLHISEAAPEPLRLLQGLITLAHQALTQTVGLLHLSQLCLLTNTQRHETKTLTKRKEKKGLSEHLNYRGALVLSGSLSQ